MLQGLVSNEGDGWQWTLEELDRYYEASAAHNFSQAGVAEGPVSLLQLSEAPETEFAREHVGYLPRRGCACWADERRRCTWPWPRRPMIRRSCPNRSIRRTSTGCAKS